MNSHLVSQWPGYSGRKVQLCPRSCERKGDTKLMTRSSRVAGGVIAGRFPRSPFLPLSARSLLLGCGGGPGFWKSNPVRRNGLNCPQRFIVFSGGKADALVETRKRLPGASPALLGSRLDSKTISPIQGCCEQLDSRNAFPPSTSIRSICLLLGRG